MYVELLRLDELATVICGGCKRSLVRDDTNFHRDRTTRDGLQSWCKQCRIAAAEKRAERDRQTVEYAKAAMAGRLAK